jgi:hypothetical protein
MRFRRRKRKKISNELVPVQTGSVESPLPTIIIHPDEVTNDSTVCAKMKRKSFAPMRLLRDVVNKPEFSYQAFMLLMTFANNDHMRIDQQIATVSTTVEKVKNATEVIGSTMKSLQAAAEAPRHIRKLFD